ncbi:unnamed protein product, partial [Ectocarpus sp. 12 AP-2014]
LAISAFFVFTYKHVYLGISLALFSFAVVRLEVESVVNGKAPNDNLAVRRDNSCSAQNKGHMQLLPQQQPGLPNTVSCIQQAVAAAAWSTAAVPNADIGRHSQT